MSTTAVALIVAIGTIAGGAVGSYSGVVAGRGWRRSQGGRSACDGCGRALRWWELVPILSYVAVRGGCARCAARIPLSLLARELAGAVAGGGLAALALAVGGR